MIASPRDWAADFARGRRAYDVESAQVTAVSPAMPHAHRLKISQTAMPGVIRGDASSRAIDARRSTPPAKCYARCATIDALPPSEEAVHSSARPLHAHARAMPRLRAAYQRLGIGLGRDAGPDGLPAAEYFPPEEDAPGAFILGAGRLFIAAPIADLFARSLDGLAIERLQHRHFGGSRPRCRRGARQAAATREILI